jgi:hypothetical protein
MRLRTLSFAVLLLALTVPVSGQRVQRYEQLTVSSTAVPITAATLSGMGGAQGVLQGAEVRYRCDGTAPTTTVGTPLQVGSTINFTNLIDARACLFIRTTGTDGVLNINAWQN